MCHLAAAHAVMMAPHGRPSGVHRSGAKPGPAPAHRSHAGCHRIDRAEAFCDKPADGAGRRT